MLWNIVQHSIRAKRLMWPENIARKKVAPAPVTTETCIRSAIISLFHAGSIPFIVDSHFFSTVLFLLLLLLHAFEHFACHKLKINCEPHTQIHSIYMFFLRFVHFR